MEPTERIYTQAVAVKAVAVPARQHNPKKPGHARIQKKWNKRFGLKEVQRVRTAPSGFADIRVVSMSRRALQRLDTLARIAACPTQEQERAAWEAKLRKLVDDILRDIRTSGGLMTHATFNCADQVEVDFIRAYLDAEAPALPVVFTIAGEPA